MTDDIVTRLRNWHTDHDSAVPRPIDLEAADEIERLRAEIEFWRTTAQTAMDNTDKALAVIELHKAMKAVAND